MKSDLIRAATVAIIVCGWLVPHGCGVGVQKARRKASQRKMGSHQVTVKPESGSSQSSSRTEGEHQKHRFACGGVVVVIDDEELTVNGASYGILNAGDSVLVDNGVVYVQGRQVQPEPLLGQEPSEATPDPEETTHQVGEYPVTVRPGSFSMSLVSAMGKDKLTAGNTVVVIDGDSLTVNGSSYGKLELGDTVLVDHGKVSVSGQARQAE